MNMLEAIEELTRIENYLLSKVPMKHVRSFMDKINWNFPVVAIVGARGVGKTTLALQRLRIIDASPHDHLYFSADNPLVIKHGIYELGRYHFINGGISLTIDEIHKYPNWSLEVKALHDSFPDRKIIVLGSSKLSLLLEKGDLSRRMLVYEMPPLSFREYLKLVDAADISVFSFEQIIDNHMKIASKITKDVPNILRHFKTYLQIGCFPYFLMTNRHEEYHLILNSILEKVIYEDISSVRALRSVTAASLKKLLWIVATSPVPQISISSLTRDTAVSRETLYDLIDLLEKADVIRIIKSGQALKGSKIFLFTPDMYRAFSGQTHIGTIRESFFAMNFKEIKSCKYEECDFIVNNLKIEIGGKSKSSNTDIVFKDDIDVGYKNSIPLYLVGFMW